MQNIPTVTKNLLIINILVFIATYVLNGLNIDLNNIFSLHFFLASDFRIWQLVTYMFMHGGVMHILMNMFMLWMFGMVVENVWVRKSSFFITWFVVLELACVRNWHNMELMYMMDWLSIILLGYPLTLLFQWKHILI